LSKFVTEAANLNYPAKSISLNWDYWVKWDFDFGEEHFDGWPRFWVPCMHHASINVSHPSHEQLTEILLYAC